MSPEDRVAEALRLASERELTPEEAAPWLEPVSTAEREEVLALRAWFCRRYPTPLERLAYVRRAYARWRRTLGTARGDGEGSATVGEDPSSLRSSG
jgi:hypothetical protein